MCRERERESEGAREGGRERERVGRLVIWGEDPPYTKHTTRGCGHVHNPTSCRLTPTRAVTSRARPARGGSGTSALSSMPGRKEEEEEGERENVGVAAFFR